jgi:uncharacterized protein (TIGR03437 family)
VGLKLPGCLLAIFLTSFSAQAAPMLRLANSTVGPVQLASAGATNTQTLEAYNAGDGTLALTFASSATWVTAATGAPRNCVNVSPSNTKTCTPIVFTINTSGLPQGLSSATVTVSGDASTVDAPQTVVVLVRVGSLDTYAAPGGSRDIGFATSSYVNASAKTADGANWLTVVNNGAGSFRFNYPYSIHFQPPDGMAAGNYTGSVSLTGSSNTTDNQTIPVTMHVVTQPIAVANASTATFAPQPTTDALNIRLAAGAPLLTYPFSANVTLSNIGQGTLTAQDPTITGAWLKPDNVPGYGVVPGYYSIDPTGLAVGSYPGSLAFASNAANGTVTVPINLQIVAKGNPLIYFQGVLDNATFTPGDTVAQGDILVVKGEQLSFSALTSVAPPLPNSAGGTSVLVNGSAVPLFYTSYGQIAFQLPYDVPTGTSLVQVKRDDGSVSNLASITVAPRAPRLLVTVNQDYSINSAAQPASAGDVLTVYCIGLGATSPAIAAGAAAPSAEPLARASQTPSVGFGFGFFATEVAPLYAGLTPTAAGLYQVNVTVPSGLPAGAVNMTVSFPGGVVSNVLPLYVR